LASSSLTSRFLGRPRAAWPHHYVGGSCQDPGSPGSPRSSEFPLRLLRCEVVREFLLLPDRAAQGLPDIFSRFFQTSTEHRLLSPAASVFSTAYPQRYAQFDQHPAVAGHPAPSDCAARPALAPAHDLGKVSRPIYRSINSPRSPGGSARLWITVVDQPTGSRRGSLARLAGSPLAGARGGSCSRAGLYLFAAGALLVRGREATDAHSAGLPPMASPGVDNSRLARLSRARPAKRL
jgi:hypothetical protein